jgi:hypothetical protein
VRGTEETMRVKRSRRRRKYGGAEDGKEKDNKNMFWYFLCTRYFHRPA